ncbi:TPA: hypothetical protein ACXPYD_002404 [Klebsiella variicola subsp. variicola]
MNIETVNEIIASLEAAGELSIKETKVMALAKAYQQLAAENSFLMHRIEWPKQQCPTTGDVTDVEPADFIPATDRIVAGIKADGVQDEPFGFVSRNGDMVVIQLNGDQHIRDGMPVFVKELREGADK